MSRFITRFLFALLCAFLSGGSIRAQLVINELHYNPPESGTDLNEFIELYNAGAGAVDLSGYSLGGVNFTFPAIVIAPDEYLVIAGNAAEFSATYGFAPDLEWTSGSLLNGGETVSLYDPGLIPVDEVSYDNGGLWPSAPNGSGPSLELRDPALDNSLPESWAASMITGGTPKAVNSVFSSTVPTILITEIMLNPLAVDDGDGEWFEIYNPGSSAVDLHGWIIRDDGGESHTIDNGGPLLIEPGAFRVLGNQGDPAANGGYPADYVYNGITLDEGGDELVLSDGILEIDRVDFDGGIEFPNPEGASIQLINFTLDNNLGNSWSAAGAREPNYDGSAGDLGSPGSLGADPTLPVSLAAFGAHGGDGLVRLNWSTQSEIDNMRFEILRAEAEDGQYLYIGEREGQLNSNVRTDYSFVDRLVTNARTYWYKLVDVDINGVRSEHGPVSATPQALQMPADPTGLPGEFRLYPNYPNPFNPATSIRFDVPEPGSSPAEITLSIYNTLGQQVKILLQGVLESGTYQVTWNGSGSNGEAMPAGVYYALFQTGTYVKVLKMHLIK